MGLHRDLFLVPSFSYLDLLQTVVNKDFKKVKIWLDANKLSRNIDKTNFIIFKPTKHSSPESSSVKIGNLTIKQKCYVKFLGVLLDDHLS